jgi:hypothetical protein
MVEGISKQLHGWIEQLKNSGITGQRHLNDKFRAHAATQKDGADFIEELQRIRETRASKSVSEQDRSIS